MIEAMSNNKFLLIIIFINFALTLFLIIKPINNDKTPFIPHFLRSSEDLQKAYLDGMIYCEEQDYSTKGQYIACMNNEIETNAQTNLKSYKRIKQFCRIQENNECDIDNCITEVILNF